MSSASAWEQRIRRLAKHTPQDPGVFETLKQAKAEQSAGDLAIARYEGHLPYGAKGCDETVEHRAFVLWVQREGLSAYPALRWLHHSPNEAAYRGLQGTGVSKGFSDFALFVPSGRYAGLAAELKGPGGRPSPEQRQWLAHLAALGWYVATPYGYEECRDLFAAYLEGREL
jgi:hypothetical protein